MSLTGLQRGWAITACSFTINPNLRQSLPLSTGNRRQSFASFNPRDDHVLHGTQAWTCHQTVGLHRGTENPKIYLKAFSFFFFWAFVVRLAIFPAGWNLCRRPHGPVYKILNRPPPSLLLDGKHVTNRDCNSESWMRYLFHRKFFKIVSSNTNFYSTPYTIINLIPSKNCPRVLYSLVAKLPFSPYLHLAQNFDHSMIFLCLCVYDNLLRPQFMQYFFLFSVEMLCFSVSSYSRELYWRISTKRCLVSLVPAFLPAES